MFPGKSSISSVFSRTFTPEPILKYRRKNKKIAKGPVLKSERFTMNQESYEVLQGSLERPILAFAEM